MSGCCDRTLVYEKLNSRGKALIFVGTGFKIKAERVLSGDNNTVWMK
jgi:hypothetical protein